MKIGIDLGGSHVAVGIVENGKIQKNLKKDIVEKRQIENVLVEDILNLIKALLDNNKLEENIEKIGISAPGIIHNDTIVKASNLNLYNFNLISKLKENYPKTEINIRNDGKCAAIAEKKYGSMQNYSDCIFMNIGTGIGGAVFLNYKLLEPKKSSGFEIGHMVIQKDGKLCTCGKKGCFEAYCSIKALKNQMLEVLGKEENITGKELWNLLKYNDKNEKIENLLDEYAENLATGISNLIDIFEPEIICFGGSFIHYELWIMERLMKKLQEPNRMFSRSKFPQMSMAVLKNEAGIIGAVE